MRPRDALRWGLRGRLVLAIAAGFTACGNPTAPGTPTPTPRVLPTATASPASDPRDASIVAAYVDATRVFVRAEQAQNPSDPGLQQTLAGSELFTVVKNLNADVAGHIVARGDIQVGHPRVLSIDGGTAVLRDCRYDALLFYSSTTGSPVPGISNGPQWEGVQATLTLADGTWKVSAADLKVGSCPVGY